MKINSKTRVLQDKLSNAKKLIVKDEIFRHYKGGIYQIDGLSINTTSGDVYILYHRIDGPDYDFFNEIGIVFNRPIGEWFSPVDHEQKSRFVKVRKITQEVWIETK